MFMCHCVDIALQFAPKCISDRRFLFRATPVGKAYYHGRDKRGSLLRNRDDGTVVAGLWEL